MGGTTRRSPVCSGPDGCIPNYPTNSPTFLDSQLASLLAKSGLRPFSSAAATRRTISTAISSSTSTTSYVYWATPTSPGQTGVRGFAGDSSGILCFSPDGDEPATTGTIRLDTAQPDLQRPAVGPAQSGFDDLAVREG